MSKYMRTCNLSCRPQFEALTNLLIHTVLPELWLLPVGTRDVDGFQAKIKASSYSCTR